MLLSANAQQIYSAEIEGRIKQIEENVGFVKFQIDGAAPITLQERMAQYHIKGLSIAVVHNYQIEWAKGYGSADSAKQIPVTTETSFCVGSVTKSINAMGVLKMAVDYKLDLNADINNYLSSWKFPYDGFAGKKISIINLLSHSAGLPEAGEAGYSINDSLPSLQQILNGEKPAKNKRAHYEFEPGKFHYSNLGAAITEKMVEDITKESYEKYMQETVLSPLGMTSSFYFIRGKEKQSMAVGYNADGNAVEGKYETIPELAAGDLWSTPTDICKYIIEMQLSLKGKSNKILSKEMTKKMLTPYIDSSALGVFILDQNGEKYFTHVGSMGGYRALYFGSMDGGNGVVILCNGEADEFLLAVVASVARTYNWKGFSAGSKPVLKKTITVPDSILKKYAGAYLRGTEVSTIIEKGNSLWYQAGGLPWKMYFTTTTDFFNLESTSEKCFFDNTSGKTGGFIKKFDGKEIGKYEKVNIATPPDSTLEKYIGTYDLQSDTISIQLKSNSLWVGNEKLIFISNTEFYLTSQFGSLFEFNLDTGGKTTGIIKKNSGEKTLIKKLK